MKLIPAIDLRHGKVIRLSQGDDGRRTEYGHDPADLVRQFADAGVSRVHVVDLDGAFGETPQRPLVEKLVALAGSLGMTVEIGGGLRDEESVAWGVEAGCERLILGSMVVKRFEDFHGLVEKFPHRLAPAVEVADGRIKISGWTESAPTGLEELCDRLRGLACPAVLVTDVDRDGTLGGPNLELARRVARLSGLPAILSGGVTDLGDLRRAAEVEELDGVIVGKAFYEGRFTLAEALEILEGPLEVGAEGRGGSPS